jgi:hypothetical protein
MFLCRTKNILVVLSKFTEMMAIFGKFFLVFNVFLTFSAYTLTNCGWKVQVFYGEKFPFTEYNELMEVILDELCYVTPDTDKSGSYFIKSKKFD